MFKKIVNNLTSINIWHLSWIAVALTEILSLILSILLKGTIDEDFIIAGFIMTLSLPFVEVGRTPVAIY